MKKLLTVAFASVALTLPVASYAQFGNLLGGGKSSSNAGADLGGQQDQLVRNYMAAGKDVQTANGHMLEAVGLKRQALNASTSSATISGKEDIEEQDKAISADSQALSDALKAGATLTDAGAKAKYAQGLVALVSGMKKYVGMRNDVQSFSSGLSGVSPLQLGKIQSGVYIVKSLPTNMTTLSTVLRQAIEFAQKNGVKVPDDATSLL